jgi:glycosyltransferase involved in cell wall biosynthesis
MNEINYTIIIPHKNIPDLLKRCLDSIPEQDDRQVIVVDDNSNIERVDFESFPGLNRKNIEVYFTKEEKRNRLCK